MKKICLLTTLMCITVCCIAQSPLNKEGFHQIILQSFDDLFSNVQTEKIDHYYAKGFLILEDGLVWNKDSVMYYLNRRKESGRKFDRKNKIDLIEFETEGNTAWGSYHNEAIISVDGGPVRIVKWLESAVLVKDDKRWKIKLLHSTRMR